MLQLDPRAVRTRAAIVRAFDELLFARGYDRVRVHDIAARASVARSTFYQHYRGKDDVLADSVARPFAALVGVVDPGAAPAAIVPLLHHVWASRAQVGVLVDGGARRAVARVLAAMIHDRIRARRSASARPRRVRLAAIALAEAMLATLVAWLHGDLPATAGELAELVHALAQPCRTLA
jgi:AcrR family transcriptional regulator